MGVIYKLKPEVIDFVLTEKRNNIALSCRGLTKVVQEKYNIRLSKSSINRLFKDSGLSMPIGRRAKKKRVVLSKEYEGVGAVLLKAADILIGGSAQINNHIANKLNLLPNQISSNTEQMFFSSLQPENWLGNFTLQKFNSEALPPYLKELEEVASIKDEIAAILGKGFKMARGVRVAFLDGRSAYIDSQFHAFWPAQNMPSEFSATSVNTISYIKRIFLGNAPLVLQIAQESDIPLAEFFAFLSALENQESRITEITILASSFEEIEKIRIPESKSQSLIFGMFPHKFTNYKSINKIGEFKQCFFAPLKQGFFIADAEVDLLQPYTNKSVTLRGAALKKAENGQIQLFILKYPSGDTLFAEQLALAEIYLSHWPNLAEGLTDFKRKLELFTYTGDHPFSPVFPQLAAQRDFPSEINALCSNYIKMLDSFVRRFFFPAEYEQVNFSTLNERFYRLSGKVTRHKNALLVTFSPPDNYSFYQALDYACRRVNEKQIILPEGRKLWLIPRP